MAQNKRNDLNQVADQQFWQNKGLLRVLIPAGLEKTGPAHRHLKTSKTTAGQTGCGDV